MLFGRADQLIYAGISGRQIEKNVGKKKYGLVTRFEIHIKVVAEISSISM